MEGAAAAGPQAEAPETLEEVLVEMEGGFAVANFC